MRSSGRCGDGRRPRYRRSRSRRQSDIVVLSSRPEHVTGGDAVIRVNVPTRVALDDVKVSLNGTDVTSALRQDAGEHALVGLVSGFVDGENTLSANAKGSQPGFTAARARAAEHAQLRPDLLRPAPAAVDLRDGGVRARNAACEWTVCRGDSLRLVLPDDRRRVRAVRSGHPAGGPRPDDDDRRHDGQLHRPRRVGDDQREHLPDRDHRRPGASDLQSLVPGRDGTGRRLERQADLALRRRLRPRVQVRQQHASTPRSRTRRSASASPSRSARATRSATAATTSSRQRQWR